jgi:hypothetical protein
MHANQVSCLEFSLSLAEDNLALERGRVCDMEKVTSHMSAFLCLLTRPEFTPFKNQLPLEINSH